MRIKSNFLLSAMLFISFFTLTSCLDEFEQPSEFSNGAKDLKDLKVSSDFDWSTSQTIQISITGLPTLSSVEAAKATLTLKGEKVVYYSGFHAINENLTFNLTVASTDKLINLKFGAIEQTIAIENDKVAFSFIPKVTDEN
jgi:hypothetical protein